MRTYYRWPTVQELKERITKNRENTQTIREATKAIRQLRAQRDDLLAACKALVEAVTVIPGGQSPGDYTLTIGTEIADVADLAAAAIERAEGDK